MTAALTLANLLAHLDAGGLRHVAGPADAAWAAARVETVEADLPASDGAGLACRAVLTPPKR